MVLLSDCGITDSSGHITITYLLRILGSRNAKLVKLTNSPRFILQMTKVVPRETNGGGVLVQC